VWKSVLDDYLREFDYMGSCASLHFSIAVTMDNIEFKWDGYNDSMREFVKGLLERLQQVEGDTAIIEHMFAQVKEKLLSDWKNFYLSQTF